MKVMRGLTETGCGLTVAFGILAFFLLIFSESGTTLRTVAECLGWTTLGTLILCIVCGCIKDGVEAAKKDEQ